MPLVDMPLEQLYEYAGRNPKPDNFDAFWDAGLRELDALDPQLEMRPHSLLSHSAECFDLFFTGTGGARVHAKYLRPKHAATPQPCVVMFHGYSGDSGDWHDKLAWVSQGFSVAALDCRGQAGQSEDPVGTRGNTLHGHIIRGLDDALHGKPEKLYYRNVFLDTALLARLVMEMPEVDAARVGALGGSQGGGLTLACAALEPRIKLAAPTFPFLCDYQRVWEMDLAKDAYAEIKNYFRHFDPRHEREQAIWTALGHIDCQHLAPRIQAQVLMPCGLADTVCPPSTQFAAFNKIPGEKRVLLYPDFGHEGLPRANDEVFDFMAGL